MTKFKFVAASFAAVLVTQGVQANVIDIIKDVNRKHFNIPNQLAIGVARTESTLRCHVTGGAGEIGLFQMKLSTARGIGYGGSASALYNCSTNAYWGLKHLSIAYAKCGTVTGAARLHNAGLYAGTCAASSYSYKVARLGSGYGSSSSIMASAKNFDTISTGSTKKRASGKSGNQRMPGLTEVESFMFSKTSSNP